MLDGIRGDNSVSVISSLTLDEALTDDDDDEEDGSFAVNLEDLVDMGRHSFPRHYEQQ